MAGKKYALSEETKKRCHVFPVDEKKKKQFTVISLELFHCLYEVKKIDFSIFFRVDDLMIEFMRPDELSNELLEKIWDAMQKGYDNVEVCIRRVDRDKFDQTIRSAREKKIDVLLQKAPELDRKILKTFENLSTASQLVVRGGITDEVVNQVKASATYLINNMMDSDLAIGTLSRMVIHDPTLYDHSASVAMIAGVVATRCLKKPLSQKEAVLVAQCGLYHDVGKTCVPGHILNKPGRFTPAEFEIMKTHTSLGNNELLNCIKSGAPISPVAARVAHEHHEKYCGGGYPLGKKGSLENDPENGIHLYTRIVSIADVYSALLMKRVYKPAYESQDAIKLMTTFAQDYDPEIFREFVKGVVESLNFFEKKVKRDKGRILVFDEQGTLQEVGKDQGKSKAS